LIVASSLKFHLDESVDHAIARGLSQRGIDATTSTQAGLIGASDEAQLEHAIAAHRVLVTHDRGFLRLASLRPAHMGIAYCPPRRQAIGRIILRLVHLWRTTTAEAMQGRIEYL
jgi:uncharacterized protein DUF5615